MVYDKKYCIKERMVCIFSHFSQINVSEVAYERAETK